MKTFLITGFLGSGKTTLIQRLLEAYLGKKIAVIENDFGPLSLDASILKEKQKNGITLKEISGGSILCTCKAGMFLTALEEVISVQPDILIIEASGITNPKSFAKILKDNNLDIILTKTFIITTVNAAKFKKQALLFPSVTHQISSADLIILNHTDLVSDLQISELIDEIKEINAHSIFLQTSFVDIDPAVIEKITCTTDIQLESEMQSPTERPEVFVLPQLEISLSVLQNFLENLLHFALRIKGYYQSEGEYYLIQDNGKDLNFTVVEYIPGKTGIEIIVPSEKLGDIKQEYVAFRKSNRR